MSMTAAEARTEIKTLFEQADAIEKKYPDGVIDNNEDATEVKRLLGEIDGLEGRLSALDEAEQRKSRIGRGLTAYRTPAERMQHPDPDADEDRALKSIGQQFIDDGEYRRLKDGGYFDSPHSVNSFAVPLRQRKGLTLVDLAMGLARKALVYSATGSAGTLIVDDRQAGIVDAAPVRERTLLDLVSRTTTDSNTIEYTRIATFTNNAAAVAEASATTGTTGTKPESALTTDLVTATVPTIAHWIPVTNAMLADAPAIRGLIDQHLMVGLELALEDAIVSGNGTPPNQTGILGAGIQSYGAAGSNNTADAILHARTLVRVNGKARPNAVAMHPNDYEAVRLLRENAATGTLGQYLVGAPNAGPTFTLWGMDVVEAEGLTENTALVGDFLLGGMLFMREEATIRTGLIDDQFVRNMQTILAELRALYAVFRPNAFCKVTGV